MKERNQLHKREAAGGGRRSSQSRGTHTHLLCGGCETSIGARGDGATGMLMLDSASFSDGETVKLIALYMSP